MENLLNLKDLLSKFTEQDINTIGQQVGLDNSHTKSAISSAIPMLLGALAKNAQSSDEAQNIAKAVERDHDGSILENLSSFLSNPNTNDGNGILKHVLGSKQDVISQFIGKEAGINSNSSSKLLSIIAPVVMGFLGKRNKETPDNVGIADLLGSFLNSGENSNNQNILSKLLDKDNDGSIIDDVLDMGKGLLGNLFK